jgi:hypothetical protein
MNRDEHVLQHLRLPKEIINYILLFDDYIFVERELIKINKLPKNLPIYTLLFDIFSNLEWIQCYESWTILRINNHVNDFRKYIRIKMYIDPLEPDRVYYFHRNNKYIRY